MTALRIYSTTYARGAVVKLCESLRDTPVAKFVIDKDRGTAIVRQEGMVQTPDGYRRRLLLVGEFATVTLAVEHCERECERIRQQLGGLGAAA